MCPAELAKSLTMLDCGHLPEQYGGWFEMVRGRLGRVDMPLRIRGREES
jgi:hypothetical protein